MKQSTPRGTEKTQDESVLLDNKKKTYSFDDMSIVINNKKSVRHSESNMSDLRDQFNQLDPYRIALSEFISTEREYISDLKLLEYVNF